MKPPFKLYWVETPSAEENCFVVARTRRGAARFEEDNTGFDPNDCDAELIMRLDEKWLSTTYGYDDTRIEELDGHYVQDEELATLGIKRRVIDGDDVYDIDGFEYRRQGDLNYVASLVKQKILIESVADLLTNLARDAPGDWIFRGHTLWSWELCAGIHRVVGEVDARTYEKRLLGEFKRKARAFLPNPPTSEWEWIILAQHFGLPTRLLDWTENPLVALFFVVRDGNPSGEDGMLWAYRNNADEIDLGQNSDPFSIETLEVVRPPHIDPRLVVQQSVFTAEPPGDFEPRAGAEMRHWHVSGDSFEDIRRELERFGISESSLFPGLATVARQLRHDTRLRVARPTKPAGD